MEENRQNSWDVPRTEPVRLPATRRELIYGAALLLLAAVAANGVITGGYNLAFSLGGLACMGCSVMYLRSRGARFSGYSTALLALAAVLALGLTRAEDLLVELASMLLLLFSVNLSLCLATGRNRRNPEAFASLADGFRALFTYGFGNLGPAVRGLKAAARTGSRAGKNTGAVLVGLLISVPLVLVLVAVLASADAAFDGLLASLPALDFGEPIASALLGTLAAWLLYSRTVGLSCREMPGQPGRQRKTVNSLTVGTVLLAVDGVYLVYLLSQLAYLTGGVSGILPEGYTMAAYARRGFFEMACLCGVNLMIIGIADCLTRQEMKMPLFPRLLCLFLGCVTVFLAVTASMKMLMYIDRYGLTRLRVLTEVVTLFIGITTVLLCVRLFVPKLPFMKTVVLVAMVLCAAVLWADVDTVVARYNVEAYLAGRLAHVDTEHLNGLGQGAVPALVRLAESGKGSAAERASTVLRAFQGGMPPLRGWNWAAMAAARALEAFFAVK